MENEVKIKINLKIGDKEFEVMLEQLKELKKQIDEILGEVQAQQPFKIYWQPPPKCDPPFPGEIRFDGPKVKYTGGIKSCQ